MKKILLTFTVFTMLVLGLTQGSASAGVKGSAEEESPDACSRSSGNCFVSPEISAKKEL